jgi:hypothetical protein
MVGHGESVTILVMMSHPYYKMKKYANLIFIGLPVALMMYGYVPILIREYFNDLHTFQIFLTLYIVIPLIFAVGFFLRRKNKK